MEITAAFRRDSIQPLFSEFLKDEELKLTPIELACSEDLAAASTSIKFSVFEKTGPRERKIDFKSDACCGFIDGVFGSCYDFYSEDYPSLKNLILVDLLVKPIFSMVRHSYQTDASTDVILSFEVSRRGQTECRGAPLSIIIECGNHLFVKFLCCSNRFVKLL